MSRVILQRRRALWRGALGCLSVGYLLFGCGRLNVELLPLETGLSPPDAGSPLDAGSPFDAGQVEAGLTPLDGGSDPAPDATTECDKAPSLCAGCEGGCENRHGSNVCVGGQCQPTCNAGFADCDGNPANGCETDLNADPRHCGDCARACAQDVEICEQGACAPSPCEPGRAECDGDPSVHCEVDTQTSVAHCGFCGNGCEVAHGEPACVEGTCTIASCAQDYADCDGDVVTGCETHLASSTLHCGGCAMPCTNAHGTTACVDGRCAPTCAAGFSDCDGNPRNGCETPLDSVEHCGMCHRTCTASEGTPVCNAGQCGVRCDLSGTYALKMTLQATWPNNGAIQSGSGTFSFWMVLSATHSGNQLVGTLRECGRYIPPFHASLVPESFLFGYPNSLFDRSPPVLPSTQVTLALTNASPSAGVSLPPSAVQIGVNMADPVNDPWPARASGIPSGRRVDNEADQKPGATAYYANTGGYIHPRTSAALIGYRRAETPYVASRVAFSLNGAFNSCSSASGSATFTHVDTRIYGCKISGSSQDCNGAEADFLDQYCLDYTLGAASFTLVRVAPNATCAEVRAALP